MAVHQSGRFAANATGELKILTARRPDNVQITLYLLKATSGPAPNDTTKIFVKSLQRDDDGEHFYGVLPALSRNTYQISRIKAHSRLALFQLAATASEERLGSPGVTGFSNSIRRAS